MWCLWCSQESSVYEYTRYSYINVCAITVDTSQQRAINGTTRQHNFIILLNTEEKKRQIVRNLFYKKKNRFEQTCILVFVLCSESNVRHTCVKTYKYVRLFVPSKSNRTCTEEKKNCTQLTLRGVLQSLPIVLPMMIQDLDTLHSHRLCTLESLHRRAANDYKIEIEL